MSKLIYKKRSGTSGVLGQLYETKLISTSLFRLLNDDDIKEFYIGSNVDGLGEFDDICIKIISKKIAKPIVIFVQAKHREDRNKTLVLTDTELGNYLNSYLSIRYKFHEKSSDVFFKGSYDDVECAFVYYTNIKDQINNKCADNEYTRKIYSVIGTGGDVSQPSCTDGNVEILQQIVLRDRIKKLAAVVANIARNKVGDFKMLMADELVKTYHVILARTVFKITDIKPDGHRIGTFNPTFFSTNDEYLLLLKEFLFFDIIKHNNTKAGEVKPLLGQLFSEPTVDTLSPLIGGVIVYKSNKLQFVDKKLCNDKELRQQLDSINVTQTIIMEAVDKVARKILDKAEFKLPRKFGNIDINLRKNDSKKGNRLNHLSTKILELLEKSQETKINDDTFKAVIIDEHFPDTGTIGNLLVLDPKTNLLMFESSTKLSGYAKMLLEAITINGQDLKQYRFVVKNRNCPKLTFECNELEKQFVNDFMCRLLLYNNQASECVVGNILKMEMAKLRNRDDQFKFQIKIDAIFSAYHDAIQKWWMQQENTEYLTKTCKLFEEATEGLITNPLLTSLAYVCANNNWCTKSDVIFDSGVRDSLKLDRPYSNVKIVLSEVIALSVIKITQSLNESEYLVLDFNYILNLPVKDYCELNNELKDFKNKILILICNIIPCSSGFYNDFIQTLNEKKLIIVTNHETGQEISKSFTNYEMVNDDKFNLKDLTNESQEKILEKAKILFQGIELNLNSLLDDYTKVMITGKQITKIIQGENITLGQPLTNLSYEKIQHCYISRIISIRPIVIDLRVIYSRNNYFEECTELKRLKTFYDMDNPTVLLTGAPGMGKSSLLTDLSLKTKALEPKVWIIRVNLLDYSRLFDQWKNNFVVIDIIEALRFICIYLVDRIVGQIMSNENISLNEINREIVVGNDCRALSEGAIFEVNMFLHFWNRRNVIFLFDGFDEICPQYENKIIEFLKVLKSRAHHGHRIWVTSRPCNQIMVNLEKEFSSPCPLLPLSYKEQEIFVKKFLHSKFSLDKLNSSQIDKINDFIKFMIDRVLSMSDLNHSVLLYNVYCYAVDLFLGSDCPDLDLTNIDEYKCHWQVYKPIVFNGIESSEYRHANTPQQHTGTPLHVYMVADYFQSEIKDTSKVTRWDLNINTYAVYKHFIETKLRKIRFEDKNKIDLHRPDVQSIYEKERKESIAKHKKLAAYMMFHEHGRRLFSRTEIVEIKATINSFKTGEETSGLVENVIDGLPRFVHSMLAEYLAVEYLCDSLKVEETEDELELLWNVIGESFRQNLELLNILNDKLIVDEEFKDIVSTEKHGVIILNVVKRHDLYGEVMAYVCHYLPHLRSLITSTFQFVNRTSLQDFLDYLVRHETLFLAARLGHYYFVDSVLNTVRNVDESKLNELFGQYNTIKWDGSNEEIYDSISAHITHECF